MKEFHGRPGVSVALLGLLLACVQLPASAAEPEQSYLGLALGEARVVDATELLSGWPDTQLTAGPEAGFAWKLFTGYQFKRWLAVETAWVQLGQSSVDAVHVSGAPLQLSTDPRGFELSALATAPLGHGVAVYARGGMFAWRNRGGAGGTDAVPGVVFPLPDDDGFSVVGGVGTQWDFGPRGTLRVDWTTYFDVAGADSAFWSAGLMRRF